MNLQQTISRFLWRVSRNTLCLFPFGRRWLFPQAELAARFGRGDAEYAWRVFTNHLQQLRGSGFVTAQRVLEIGPGKNLGTALLWWAYNSSQQDAIVEVVCWDVFKNAEPDVTNFWSTLASDLLKATSVVSSTLEPVTMNQLQKRLSEVAAGLFPRISYQVLPLKVFERKGGTFDLIYSQAAIEHVWLIESFWDSIIRHTAVGGWHSHRIDLADHGRRDTNYLEMLEWSRLGYWLTMRFVPGATNRWRACHHLVKLEDLGLKIIHISREKRDNLPVPINHISNEFRELGEEELRTSALDLVAVNR